MRLSHIRVRGLDPYIEENFVDIAGLPGPLVAVIGGNGEGKSTLLNFFPAATVALNKKFLKMPKPDGRPLADLSVAKDSFLEIGYHFGQDYIVRHSINGLNGKTDCSVTNGDGQALLKGKSGSTEFLGWAAEHSLPPEVFFGSVFSSQGTHGMLGMDPAERKAVILRVIGLERYEKLAKAARDKRSECDKQLAIVSGKLQELRGDTVEACEQQILRLTDDQRIADEALRLGELTLKDLQTKNAATEKQQTEYTALVTRRVELESQESKLAARIAELDTLIQNNSGLLEKADEIRAAVTRLEEISVALNELNSQASEQRVRESEINAETRQIESEERTANERARSLQVEMQRLNDLIAGAEAARFAAASIPDFEESLKETEHERDEALAEYDQLLDKATTTGDASRKFLRGELGHIADGKAEDPVAYAGSSLSADDLAMKETAERPKQILTAKTAWQQADARAKAIGQQLASLRLEAAKLEEIDRASSRLSEASDALTQVGAELNTLSERKADNATARGEILGTLGATNATIKALTSEADELNLLARRGAPLAEAETKIGAYQQERVKINNDREGVLELLSKVITDAVEPPKLLNLTAEEQAVDQARRAATQCMSMLAIAQDALTRATAQEARRVELQEEVKVLGRDMADWKRLADDLGKDGVQALSVDAAAPELTTLANDLLQASGDTRFSLKISTTRMDSKGKKELEGFEIEITDSRKQGTKTGGSGGEESYLNKALAFSLTMMACRHMGLDKPTIVDDEGDAALSVEYAPGYVLMLRRAAELMDASKVLFVTHRPDSWNMADSRLEISAGAISVT